MPCYTVVTSSIEFKIGNIKILEQALKNAGWEVYSQSNDRVIARSSYRLMTIDLKNSKISSQEFNEKQLTEISNSIKRSYSEVVIDELARKNKWIKKQLGQQRYQLQRF